MVIGIAAVSYPELVYLLASLFYVKHIVFHPDLAYYIWVCSYPKPIMGHVDAYGVAVTTA